MITNGEIKTWKGKRKVYGLCCVVVSVQETHSTIPVTIARGIHLFPFRTQKLSLLAPNVLGWKRPGRIGRCRFPNKKASERNKQVTNLTGARFFVCLEGKTRPATLLFSPLSAASCARAWLAFSAEIHPLSACAALRARQSPCS